MAGFFWQPTADPNNTAFTDANFFSYTTEGQAVSRPEFSRSLMKFVFPQVFFRKYVSKWTNFKEGASHYYVMYKKITRPEDQAWEKVNEFDPLPTIGSQFKQFSIAVEERGVQIPLTLRAKIFSNIDLEAELKAHLSDVVKSSIERDLLLNAFAYLDVIGEWKTTGLTVNTGVSLNQTKTFASETQPITITQYNISGTGLTKLTAEAIRQFGKALEDMYCPSYNGEGYGKYLVILNTQAYNELLTDPEIREAFTRIQDRDYIRSGYLGFYHGFEFVLDTGKWMDRFLPRLQTSLNGKAIALFLSRDAVREAIIKPEDVKTKTGDFDRYMAFGVYTYRGESPTWFSVEGQPAGGWLIGA